MVSPCGGVPLPSSCPLSSGGFLSVCYYSEEREGHDLLDGMGDLRLRKWKSST